MNDDFPPGHYPAIMVQYNPDTAHAVEVILERYDGRVKAMVNTVGPLSFWIFYSLKEHKSDLEGFQRSLKEKGL